MININIWDDYNEEDENDPCFMYIEERGIPLGIEKVYLECILKSIKDDFGGYIHLYEPAKLYPNLIGQMNLDPRYELRFNLFSHNRRLKLLEVLKNTKLKYQFNFYSES